MFELATTHRNRRAHRRAAQPRRAGTALQPDRIGWLDAYTSGLVLAVGVTADSVVHITELGAVPATDGGLVQRLRVAYDRAIEEPPLPLTASMKATALSTVMARP